MSPSSDAEIRKRAMQEALGGSRAHLARARAREEALARHVERAARRRRVAGPLGIVGLVGGAALAIASAAAVIATPVGWIAAVIAASAGLGGLSVAGAAARREEAARTQRNSMRLGHDGRALEVDGLLARIEGVRAATASDYARYEQRVLAQVNPGQHAANATLLQSLRARQLAHVKRLDEVRAAALALRARLVKAAIADEVDKKLEALEPAREVYRDRLARSTFERGDAQDELARLAAETDALEALEAEYR